MKKQITAFTEKLMNDKNKADPVEDNFIYKVKITLNKIKVLLNYVIKIL